MSDKTTDTSDLHRQLMDIRFTIAFTERQLEDMQPNKDITIGLTDDALAAVTALYKQHEQQAIMETRLNELKHRADDIINRMYRLDRDFADNYIADRWDYVPLKALSQSQEKEQK